VTYPITDCAFVVSVHGLQVTATIDQFNYPETAKRLYVINAPWVFTGFWKIAQRFVDPRTKQKVPCVLVKGCRVCALPGVWIAACCVWHCMSWCGDGVGYVRACVRWTVYVSGGGLCDGVHACVYRVCMCACSRVAWALCELVLVCACVRVRACACARVAWTLCELVCARVGACVLVCAYVYDRIRMN
jgi:hypothetical protein